VGESGKGNGKVKVGNNVLPINLLPYLAEAYKDKAIQVINSKLKPSKIHDDTSNIENPFSLNL
jgi:hypothetical protein